MEQDDGILDRLREMGADFDHKVDEDFPIWILSLIFVQAVLTFVGIHFLFLFLFLFKKKTLFHQNLNIIAFNTAFLWLMVMTCRFIIAISGLLNWHVIAVKSTHVVMKPYIYVELIRVAFGYSALFGSGSIILERVIATIFLGLYERKTHPVFVFLLILSIWLFGFTSAIYAFGRPHASLFTIIGLTLVSLFIAVGYSYAVMTNRRRLRQTKTKTFEYTLSQRFQLQENVRMLQIIRKCLKAFIPVMIVFTCIWCIFAFIYYQTQHKTFYYLMRETTHISSCLCADILLYACSTGTYQWSSQIKAFFQRIHQRFTRKGYGAEKIQPELALVNTDGRQIGFDVSYEAQIYFTQLEMAWSKKEAIE